MASLRFSDYHNKRQRVDEVLDWFKKKGKQAVGYEDEAGKTSVDKVAAVKGAQAGAEAGGGVAGAVSAGVGVATNVATGNVFGAAKNVWELIKSIVSAGSGLRGMGQAGTLVGKCMQHKKGLQEYLTTQRLESAAVTQVVDAVFEIDSESAWEIPNPLWGPITTDFSKQLDDGYHGIENKIFCVVVAKHLREWIESRYGTQADDTKQRVEDAMKRLVQEIQHAKQVLQTPGQDGVPAKDKVEEFNPDSAGQHQEPVDARQPEAEAQPEQKEDPKYGPITRDRYQRVPDIFFAGGGDTKIKDELVDEFWRWSVARLNRWEAKELSQKKLAVGKPVYVKNDHYMYGHNTKGILMGMARDGESGYFDAHVKMVFTTRTGDPEFKRGGITTFMVSNWISPEPFADEDERHTAMDKRDAEYRRYGIEPHW